MSTSPPRLEIEKERKEKKRKSDSEEEDQATRTKIKGIRNEIILEFLNLGMLFEQKNKSELCLKNI